MKALSEKQKELIQEIDDIDYLWIDGIITDSQHKEYLKELSTDNEKIY